MFPELKQAVESHLPSKRKKTPSGWTSFNAPCCVHNNESADNRMRGGIMFLPDGGIQYHCFNCGWKTNYTPGRYLSRRFRQFMQWLNIPMSEIGKLSMVAIGYASEGEVVQRKLDSEIKFDAVKLPADAVVIVQQPDCVQYLASRGLTPSDGLFFYAPSQRDRIIIPVEWQSKPIGFVARAMSADTRPKYFANVQPGTVFNMDKQHWSRKFVIVVEGIFDAIVLDGVAILGSEIAHKQKLQLDSLNREVIVVPDRDKAGTKLIDQAIEYNWSVSLPPWHNDVKDVNNAVLRYGKVLTMQAILKHKHTNKTKIKLHEKLWLT
jgi:hypothetical protein